MNGLDRSHLNMIIYRVILTGDNDISFLRLYFIGSYLKTGVLRNSLSNHYKTKQTLEYGILMGPQKTSHVETCDNLSFSHFLACHLSYIHTRFNNPREITGAIFYVLNSRLCFLKSRIVNRCSIIRNKETCETLKNLAISPGVSVFITPIN